MSAIDDLKKMLKQAQDGNFEVEPEIEEIQEEAIPKVSALEQLKDLLREAAPKHVPKEIIEESIKAEIETLSEKDIVQMTADLLGKSNKANNIPAAPQDIESQRWNDPLRNTDFVTQKQMNDHYTLFLQRIQQQMSTMGGSGEVKFRYLDDVNRATLTPNNDNHLLEYDAATKKVQFTNQIGPIEHIMFDLNHDASVHNQPGTLSWSAVDQTLNLEHLNGVTQQIGQETYAYVNNQTGNTITNGTAVMFAGAASNGASGARVLVSPIVASGSFPSLYALGIATEDIATGENGRVTVWGKLRDVDTSAFEVGDILYADPFNAGGLTNIKPTAPNNVVPMCAVLTKDSQAGELFVRPIVTIQEYYGRFSRVVDQTVATEDTPTPVIFDTTEISNGITLNGSRIEFIDSGFYQISGTFQITASSHKGLVYTWVRKNGVDVDHSTHVTTVTNGDTFTMPFEIQLSLDINDYIEIYWARSAAGIFLDAFAATAFAPSSSAVSLNVAQIQL